MNTSRTQSTHSENLSVLCRRNALVHIALIALLGISAYAITLDVPFYYDGYRNINDNVYIRDLGNFFNPSHYLLPPTDAEKAGLDPFELKGLLDFRARMVGFLSFAINYRLHGLNVFGYHLTNLLIHLGAASALYFIVLLSFETPLLASSRMAGQKHCMALMAAALFVVHPVQTQAVTYIVQRFASLAGLLSLMSLLFYIKGRLGGAFRLPYLAAAFVCSCMAMDTKQSALMLPVAIALYELAFLAGPAKKRIAAIAPILATMLIIPIGLFGTGISLGEILERVEMESTTPMEYSQWGYIMTEARVLLTYLRLFALPVNQNFIYDYPHTYSYLSFSEFAGVGAFAGLAGLGLWLITRPDGLKRLAGFGILWFFIMISVESVLVPLYVINEHRLYLPSAGVFIAVSAAAIILRDRFGHRIPGLLRVAPIAVVLMLLALTISRNALWRDQIAFWEDVVAKSPLKESVRINLGIAKLRYNLSDLGAQDDFLEAMEINELTEGDAPFHSSGLLENVSKMQDQSVIYFDLGLDYTEKGNLKMAAEMYEKSLEINPSPGAFNNLGNTYLKLGQLEDAAEAMERAVEFDPAWIDLRFNLALIYIEMNDKEHARQELKEILKLSPKDKDAKLLLKEIGK